MPSIKEHGESPGLLLTEIPDTALESLRDLVEHRCDTIVERVRQAGAESVGSTVELFKDAMFFYNLYPSVLQKKNPYLTLRVTLIQFLVLAAHDYAYGALTREQPQGHARRTAAEDELVQPSTGALWDVYKYGKGGDDNNDDDDADNEQPTKKHDETYIPLVQWDTAKWIKLGKELKEMAKTLEQDCKQAGRKYNRRHYRRDLDRMRLLFKVGQHMALLDRWGMERRLGLSWDESRPIVEPNNVEKFRESVEKESVFKVQRALNELLDLLTNPMEDTNLFLDDIAEAVAQKPFELINVRTQFIKLLISWYDDCFGGSPSVLTVLGYGDGDKEHQASRATSQEQLRQLRAARTTLREETVDPLPEALVAAGRAVHTSPQRRRRERDDSDGDARERKRPKGDLYEKRPSASRIQFDDDSDQNGSGVRLTALPERVPRIKASPSGLVSPVRLRCGGRTKKPYSTQEIQAIKEGVKIHGKGKWAEIKSEYPFVLKERSAVDIKDKYRNMLKKGEITESEKEDEEEEEE